MILSQEVSKTPSLNSKYFRLSAYVRKARLIAARLVLGWGIPLKNKTRVDGYLIRFKASSFLEYFLRAEESYTREKVTMYWIRNYISEDDVILDIGANVGAYSLLIGKMVTSGHGRVYAIEPEASNFKALNDNIRLNSLSSTVTPFLFAFGDSRRVGDFFLSSTEVGAALHAIDKPESDGVKFEAKHTQGVLIESVDSFLSEEGILFPNHIKIDVDGVEKMIVSHMANTLKDKRLRTVMIEIEIGLSGGEIEKIFASFGFQEKMREQMAGRAIYNVLYERNSNTEECANGLAH